MLAELRQAMQSYEAEEYHVENTSDIIAEASHEEEIVS
jgi:hypothetical protein